jgi:plastocyanin
MSFRRFAVAASFSLLGLGCSNPATPTVPQPDIAISPGAVALGPGGFTPNPITKTVHRVTWLNGDYTDPADLNGTGTVHHLISDENLFDSGDVGPAGSFSFRFPGPGTYHYHCLNHPTMTGTITIAQ